MKHEGSYRVSLDYILGQFLVDTLASYLFQASFNIILNRRLSLLNCHFPLGLPTKILYPILICFHAACPVQLILLDLFTLMIPGECLIM